MVVQPRLSAAVMLVRDAASGGDFEVFMVRRAIQSDFMPDVYVFPGGSVQTDDRTAEETTGVCREVVASAADPENETAAGRGVRVAAIRELFEEAGVLLAYEGTNLLTVTEENRERFADYRQALNERRGSLTEIAAREQLTLACDRLDYCAHWITPEGLPKRFNTYFFVTPAPPGQQAIYDNLETSAGTWIAPAEALARAERDEFPIVFATIHQLRDLAAFNSVSEILQRTAQTPVQTRRPVLIERNGHLHAHLAEQSDDLWAIPEHLTRVDRG